MTGLVLLWCLTQAPSPLAVVVSSKRAGADTFASSTAARMHAALLREGFPPAEVLDDAAAAKRVRVADARKCQGGASCLAKLAVLVGPDAVVIGVDVGKIGTQLAVRFEAVSAKTGKSLALADVSAPVEGWGDKLAVPIALFVRQLAEKLAALRAEPVVVPTPPVVVAERPKPDAPVAVDLTPPPPPPPAVEVKPGRPAALKWTFGIGAVASTGVSIGFLVAGLGTRSAFLGKGTATADGLMATGHTASEAARLSATSNTQLTISLVSGVVAALLTGFATWLFLTE